MPTDNVQFKRGTAAAFANVATKDPNTIYFITDTNRIYVGDSEYSHPVLYGSAEPSSTMPQGALYIREITENNIIRQQLYYSNGNTWTAVNVEPGSIFAEAITAGNNGNVAPTNSATTFKVPTITVDTKGRVSNVVERTIDLVNFMPKSGGTFTGDVVVDADLTAENIKTSRNINIKSTHKQGEDGNHDVYNKATINFINNGVSTNEIPIKVEAEYDLITEASSNTHSTLSAFADTFSISSKNISIGNYPNSYTYVYGKLELDNPPSNPYDAVTKEYLDNRIASAISASDAMVLKGTLGTNGTATTFANINLSTAIKGDTYKVITVDTLPAANSSDSTAHILTPGDLIVYMGENKFIYVPSGDEDVTSIKVAGSGDTINVSTTAQTGNLVLGTAASVNTASTVTNDSTTVPTTAAVKTYVDSAESLAMPKTGGTFTGDVTMNADFTVQDEITIASTDTQENLVHDQQHSDTKLIFDNANPVGGAAPMCIEGYYNASVYGTHAYDDSTIKINATNFEAGGLIAKEIGGTGYGTGSDITTGMVFLNTNEVRLAATEQTAKDAIGMIDEIHDKVNLAFSNTGFYSVTNEATASIEGYYTFKEYDDEDNTNNVDMAHLDLIADDIKLDGDVKVTNNLTTKTFTINPEDGTNITTSGQIHDISTLTFANDNQVNNTDKPAAIVAQYSANVVGGGVHVEDWSTLKLQADTVQLADLTIGGVDIGSSQAVTLTPQHDIPIDREQKVDSESIIMRYNVAQYEGQNDSTDIVLNASNIIAQGPVTLPNNPTQANHAVNKVYVDTALSNITDTKVTTVTTTGDGNAVTAGSISADGTTLTLTKDANFVPATGGTFSGDVTIEGTLDVNNINNLIIEKREAYENYTAIRGTRLSSIIPTDNNNLYTSPTIDITWNQGGGGSTFTKLSLNAAGDSGHIELNAGSGINANAPLYLSRTPEGAREAATKGYVDNAVSTAALTWGTI